MSDTTLRAEQRRQFVGYCKQAINAVEAAPDHNPFIHTSLIREKLQALGLALGYAFEPFKFWRQQGDRGRPSMRFCFLLTSPMGSLLLGGRFGWGVNAAGEKEYLPPSEELRAELLRCLNMWIEAVNDDIVAMALDVACGENREFADAVDVADLRIHPRALPLWMQSAGTPEAEPKPVADPSDVPAATTAATDHSPPLGRKAKLIEYAISIISLHPELTDREVARQVGLRPYDLSRSEKYRSLRDQARELFRRDRLPPTP